MMNKVTSSSDVFSRPHFFPGQSIDFRDFNRMARQPDLVQSHLFRSLYPNGGIFYRKEGSFTVKILSDLKVEIEEGSGILPDGQMVTLKNSLQIDLSDYQDRCNGETLFVSLSALRKGTDSFVDPTDPSISGFQTEIFEPQLIAQIGELAENSIELFRVRLTRFTEQLRVPLESELGSFTQEEKNRSAIDPRYRREIIPNGYQPLSVDEWLDLRRTLEQAEESYLHLKTLFVCERSHLLNEYFVQFHAALLETPLQPRKVRYLISEISNRISRFLGDLANRVPRFRKELNRELIDQILKKTPQFRKKTYFDFEVDFLEFREILKDFNRLSDQVRTKLDFSSSVRDSLGEMKERAFGFESRAYFSGFLFEKVDHLYSEAPEVRVFSESRLPRQVSSRYQDGRTLSRKGVFISQGQFGLTFKVNQPTAPTVIVLRSYERRKRGKLRFLLNGKTIDRFYQKQDTLIDRWTNLAWLVPTDHLVAQSNQFTIQIEESDLDYGFFELAVYQLAGAPQGESTHESA